ncbi:MAG: VOC family protein [Eubacteriales bacterium]
MKDVWNGLIAFYGTENLEKTHKFYSELLELNLFKNQGKCKIYQVPNGGKIGFCEHLENRGGDKGPIITLLANDVDKVYAHIARSGYKVPPLPEENDEFGIYHFFVEDPNGYKVEIQKFKEDIVE